MEELNNELQQDELQEQVLPEEETEEPEEILDEPEEEEEDNEPHDKNVKLMSPGRMVLRRFFRSKLSVVGLVMVISLFLFSFLGPVVYNKWGETDLDRSGKIQYQESLVTFTGENGVTYELKQVNETELQDNLRTGISAEHPLGTDAQGYDVLARLMYGGRISLIVSFLAVILITVFGVIMGGISGYFGGWIDSVIMRLCDILTCLPGIPILLIIYTILDAAEVNPDYTIYLLMIYLSFISWPGTARLVRGQILSLREQEYMVAAEAMGYSTGRKIFKHLVPNVMPQLIVQTTLSLGSMILYEATLSYLGLGVQAPRAAWGTTIEAISKNSSIITDYPLEWVPAGLCIVIAVLGFNFVGDGLRDALDPKARR